LEILESVEVDETHTTTLKLKRIQLSILFLFISLVAWSQQLEVIVPSTFVAGKAFPVVLEATVQNELDLYRSENISVSMSGAQESNGTIKLKKGRSMSTFQSSQTANTLVVTGQGVNISVPPNLSQEVVHTTVITGTETWQAATVHRISSDLYINANASLFIEPGCWVLLDSAVNIIVEGVLESQGDRANPITFCSNTSASWGGIVSVQGTVNMKYCLLNNGGGDLSRNFGHSSSQPVLKTEGGYIKAVHTFIFDCIGKGLGGENGNIEFNRGGISRCDTGGEFGGTRVLVSASHIIDIPDDDGLLEDDDNDGFYFSGAASLPSIVDSCVFMNGEDDAIDHNNAILEVRNTWVENFENEGVAASTGNSVLVYNSLFKNCEQGIEAGYGSPQVTVNHCVMIGNDNGLRFGDWYDWGCTGFISCTNSIMFNNLDNVYNHDILTNGPVANAISLTFSITNDLEYDANTGCVTGIPSFTNQYQLEPGSVGVGVASDGFNMGLISHFNTGIHGSRSEQKDRPIEGVRIFDLNGKLIFAEKNARQQVWDNLVNGIYIVEQDHGSYVKRVKRVVMR
jgi:hypothetical protein